VSVHELLQNALEICRADVRAKGLMVMIDLGALNDRVEGDAARLQQVFWNLLKNGVKFTPAGGEITIRTRNDGDRIAIEIADTGIGIEPSMAEAIFTPFVQGEPEITRRYGGLGLGLAISRSIVEMHDGRISAASPGAGCGSTFSVALATLPADDASDAVPSASGRSDAQEVKVLVIDDRRDGDGLVRLLAEERGLQLYTVYDAAIAEQIAATYEIDLVVGSIAHGDRDDAARVERIVGSGRHRSIVIRDDGGGAPDATIVRGSATLIRPVTSRTLRETIDQLLA
jgi:anti-sigma regulatory factor (Ser/Thr protein kinase)